MDRIVKTTRNRYLHQVQSVGESSEFTRREVKASADSWGPDWSAPSRNVAVQIALADYIAQNLQPDAMAVLNTPERLGTNVFLGRLEALRTGSARLHLSECPPRRLRKLEYIAALEYGLNPRTAKSGRLHAHVLLYNLGSIRLDDLARLWRELNHIKNTEEPLIRRYTEGAQGIRYCIKALGSDVDSIYISPKLSLQMAAA